MEINITFVVSTTYSWTGELSELPAKVRKGVTRREDGETVLVEDELQSNLDDEDDLLLKLAKTADEEDQSIEVETVEQLG